MNEAKRNECMLDPFVGLPGKFNIIYADPPWNGLGWNNGSGRKCPANHYPVMSDDDILRLPVASICADNAALFLWVTFPNLPLGLRVIDAWGFRYATQAFTWVKRTKRGKWFWGCGNYTRANAEVCLLGVRGTMKRQSASVLSVVDAVIGRHSAKPAEVRDRIVRLMGDVPRVELFARERVQGWEAWGNEVEANKVVRGAEPSAGPRTSPPTGSVSP